MIKKVIFFSMLFIIISSLSLIFILGSNLIGMNHKVVNISKNIMFNIMTHSYINGCKSPIYYSGKYLNSNKIDVIVCNHMTNLDFIICASIIQKFDKRNIYFVYQKELVYIPILGSFGSMNDIGIYFKDATKSKMNIANIIKNIDSGIIVIMPEGVVSSNKLKIKSDEYCIANNIPILKNVLYPRVKGLWLICNTLIKMNKMGNLIDMSIIIENFYKKQITVKNILMKEFGNTLVYIKNIPYDIKICNNYLDFKLWFIKKWILKDNILETMLYENKYSYTLLKPKKEIINYLFVLLIIILFIYLIITTKGLYLVYSIIISFIILIIKNNFNIKNIFNFIHFLLFQR